MKFELKFKYGDKVKVIGGFYAGKTGVVVDVSDWLFSFKYMVKLDLEGDWLQHKFIKEKYLEAIE